MNKKGRKFFLLERDINTLHALEARLRISGFEVEVDSFLDEPEALLKKIKMFAPDFIFLGLRLSDLDFLSRIKGNEDLSRIPFFVFFDVEDKNILHQAEKAGAEFCFLYPDFSLDEVVGKILKITKRKYN